MKTKEELNTLKKEVEAMNKKLADLTEDELKQVSAGWEHDRYPRGHVEVKICSVCRIGGSLPKRTNHVYEGSGLGYEEGGNPIVWLDIWRCTECGTVRYFRQD